MSQLEVTVSSSSLTPAELRVLRYLILGLTNIQIAKQVDVNQRTVQAHMSNILSKTHFTNRTALALWAIKQPEVINV